MILAVDIGNSNIVFGIFDEHRLLFTARAKTDALKSEWEYAVLINEMMMLHKIDRSSLEGGAISCVVPALTSVMADAIKTLRDVPIVTVGPGVKTGLNIRIDEPASTGADLVCTSVGAIAAYPLPAMVIDLGTATKLTVIATDKSFIGGAIVPGVTVSLQALSRSAAQLPHIGLDSRIKVMGTNTIDCMMSGSILGTASMIDGMIVRFRESLGYDLVSIIACGGLVNAVIPHCRTPIIIDNALLLNGLISIYRRNIT